jgi:hypothetical protein
MRLRLLAVIVATLLMAACADLTVLEPCEQFAQVEAARDQVNALDPNSATAEDARDIAQDILDELRDFETASDGLFAIQIETYRQAVEDVQQVLVDVEGGATASEWAPVLSDSLRESSRAFAQLKLAVDPACKSES